MSEYTFCTSICFKRRVPDELRPRLESKRDQQQGSEKKQTNKQTNKQKNWGQVRPFSTSPQPVQQVTETPTSL